MAITLVKEILDRRSSVDWKNNRQFSRTWEVLTDDPHDTQVNVELAWIADTGITAGTLFPGTLSSRAKDISINCVATNKWEVVCNYETTPREDTNPLNQPLQIKGGFNKITEKTEADIFGRAILNSAYDPFSEALEIEVSQHTASYTKNVAWYAFSPAYAGYYSNAINASPFLGIAARSLKVTEFTYDSQWDAQIGHYWTVSVAFTHNPNTWVRLILDRGFRYLDSGTRKDIFDPATKKKITEPALLDGAGGLLPQGTPEQYRYTWVNPILPFNYFTALMGIY